MNDTILSLVVPIRNDAAHLVDVVQQYLAVIPRHFADYEIILVNDGSSDATLAQAHDLVATYDPVMVLHSARRRGYGHALITGVKAARGDYILCTDIQNAIPITEIARLMPFLDRYDVITGYPIQKKTTHTGGLGATLLRQITNWLFDLELRNVRSHVHVVRADLLRTMTFYSDSALVFIEMIVKASHQQATQVQVGVTVDPRASSKLSHAALRLKLGTFWELGWLRMRLGKATAPAHTAQQPLWRQKATMGAGLAAVAGGIWFLLRRRSL